MRKRDKEIELPPPPTRTPLRVASWNVNGIRARLEGVLQWLDDAKPDVLCMQEIKSENDAFPTDAFDERGWNVLLRGEKGFNGVAILSRHPLELACDALPGDEDDAQARYLEAIVSLPIADSSPPGSASAAARAIRTASIYLPNGNPADGDKFRYKMRWMERLHDRARELLALEEHAILAGDYNVIPDDEDVADPEAMRGDALIAPETRRKFRSLLRLGWSDAFRTCVVDGGRYTFWDYQGGAWRKNRGMRIDHVLVSPRAADRLKRCGIDATTRGGTRPSDHVPIVAEFAF